MKANNDHSSLFWKSFDKVTKNMKLMSGNPDVKSRVFLIGAPRSGTTIFQVLMAAHPKIHSFPETCFFIYALGWHRRKLGYLGLARGRHALKRTLHRVGREDLLSEIPRHPLDLYSATRHYIRCLDHLTLEQGKNIWLEKSPLHYQYIPLIERVVPNVHFLHIIRNGCDVVASIQDMANRFPTRFPYIKNVDWCIQQWNSAIETSAKYLGNCKHSFVLYEELAENPDETLMRICSELGIDYDPCMRDTKESAQQVIRTGESHMFGAKDSLKKAASKFERVFDSPCRSEIYRQLNLSTLTEIKEAINSAKQHEIETYEKTYQSGFCQKYPDGL